MLEVIICNTTEIKKTDYIELLYFIRNINNECQSGIIVGVFEIPERKNLCVREKEIVSRNYVPIYRTSSFNCILNIKTQFHIQLFPILL